jgi:TonB family protein
MDRERAGERLWRIGLLLFSAALHLGLFLFLLNLRYTIDIFEDRDLIRNVVIVPEENLKIPTDVDSVAALDPEEIFLVGRRRAERARDDVPTARPLAGSRPVDGSTAAEPLREGGLTLPTVRFRPSASLRFNMDWSARLKTDEEPYFDLALGRRQEPIVPDSERYLSSRGEAADMRRYIRPKDYVTPLAKHRDRSSASPVPLPGPAYDLSPWAEQILGRIQNLWRLDAAQRGEPRGRVELKIVVDKDGSVSAIEILRSSDDEGLDRAAVRAVESNMPFPPLPGDFPLDRLEFRLVFEYDY